jgi:predicted amidohydrolase YtcJ
MKIKSALQALRFCSGRHTARVDRAKLMSAPWAFGISHNGFSCCARRGADCAAASGGMGMGGKNCGRFFAFIAGWGVVASLAMGTISSAAVTADLVILNAKVHTMDQARPKAEAVAIYGNRIAAVGTSEEMRRLAGNETRVVDAGGKLVLPGFNDAHVHFLMGGFGLSEVKLRDAKSPEEMAERLRKFAEKLPKGQWIVGGEWDHESWPGTPLPHKEWIDAATPNHPVFISRLDGHMALANSLALKLAGVTKESKEIDGGLIVRDKNGEPTGLLKDAAMAYVDKVIPDKTFEEKLVAAKAASDYAASVGVTSVQDMSTGQDIGVYQTLLSQGGLKTRIYGMSPISSWERLGNTGIKAPYGNEMLRIGGLKGFSDGSLGSSTALFFEPYADDAKNRGLPGPQMFPAGIMLKRVLEADRAGLQIVIHAIGDEANAQVLDIYKKTAEKNGARDRRPRIEHAQHLRAQEIPRFGAEHVIASMQPYHAIDDGRWCEDRIGKERTKGTYAFRTLLDTGATLAFGSDWTVAPLNPMTGVYAAVTRRTLDGKHPEGWVPEQKITLEETLRAYTVGSAYAEFMEKVKGTITPGKLADIVILDRDLFAIDPEEILNTKVVLTVMDGKVVYEAGK